MAYIESTRLLLAIWKLEENLELEQNLEQERELELKQNLELKQEQERNRILNEFKCPGYVLVRKPISLKHFRYLPIGASLLVETDYESACAMASDVGMVFKLRGNQINKRFRVYRHSEGVYRIERIA